MIVLSIDPGIEKTGYAIFKKDRENSIKFVNSGLIKTDKKKLTEKRFLEIYLQFVKVIQKYKPSNIVLERLFLFKNHKTVITVAQSQGIILLVGAQHGLPVEFLTPLQIKQIITGYGNADKKSVEKMINLTFPIDTSKKEDDEVDAIACGLAYCYLNKKLLQ
ncbi:MAG: crossover junction endodeoxyribonuclease RuvC [bacterium]|nr:crossover junction endodeoxyribonuclease RuvC [bacterium]